MPAVSVIIATYNHAGYLAEAVESVLAQTFTDFELLVIDDGSTDATPEVLADLADRHAGRFRSIRQVNAGVGAAMNAGLAATSGPLIAFLDSDDAWAPDHLATLVPMLADRAAVAAFGRRDAIDAAGRPVDRPGKPYASGRITTDLFASIFISKICLVARRSAVEQVGRFDTALRMGEDYELLLRLSRLGEIRGTDAIVAHRRRHGSNLTADSAEFRVRTAALLERFYFKLDGWRDVAAKTAARRLARAHYVAGKKMLGRGDARVARVHLARSIAFAPTLKAWAVRLAAWAATPVSFVLERDAAPSLPVDYQFVPLDKARGIIERARSPEARG